MVVKNLPHLTTLLRRHQLAIQQHRPQRCPLQPKRESVRLVAKSTAGFGLFGFLLLRLQIILVYNFQNQMGLELLIFKHVFGAAILLLIK